MEIKLYIRKKSTREKKNTLKDGEIPKWTYSLLGKLRNGADVSRTKSIKHGNIFTFCLTF
jgi:hypothetical protein